MHNAQSLQCGCDTFPLGVAGEGLHTPLPGLAQGRGQTVSAPRSTRLLIALSWAVLAASWPPHPSSYTTATHSLCPFPQLPRLGLPLAWLHAQFLPGLEQPSLKPAGADLPAHPGNGAVQASLLSCAPTLSSRPFFIYNSSFLLTPETQQSSISSQVGRHQAGFIQKLQT